MANSRRRPKSWADIRQRLHKVDDEAAALRQSQEIEEEHARYIAMQQTRRKLERWERAQRRRFWRKLNPLNWILGE